MSIKLKESEVVKAKIHMDIISQYQSEFEKMKFALSKSQEIFMSYLNTIVMDRNEDASKNYQLNLNDFTLVPEVQMFSNNGSTSSNGSGQVEFADSKDDLLNDENNHMDP